MGAPIALDDPAARDPVVVGRKAARLAHAAAVGLPVLPGWVLPLCASGVAVARGVDALARSGAPSAYLAATDAAVPGELAREIGRLAISADGPSVVRSSTVLDDDGRWSGAFASYVSVDAGDLPTAVRGCWASAFSRDVLARCRETGIDVEGLRIGVLVQPFVGFDVGGTARLLSDGSIVVTAVPGGPNGVVGGGRSAVDVMVAADGRCMGEIQGADVPTATAEAAAILARRAAAAMGAGAIEWGASGEEVVLLQVRPAPPARADIGRISRTTANVPAGAEHLVRLVTAFPGPLGDELVLPWALGTGRVPDVEALEGDSSRSALDEARSVADGLASQVWGLTVEAAKDRAAFAVRLLRRGHILEGLRSIRGLHPPDTAAARRLVGLIAWLGRTLAERGTLPSADLVWRLAGHELDRAIDGERVALRRGPDRWEPFVAEVVRARGTESIGTAAAPGIGAGRPHLLGELRDIGFPRSRDVLAAPLPLPQLSPLLWHCAGLVTAGGSTGAHLFEVARSLGVPAVMDVDLTALGGEGSLVAVDGETGGVSVLSPGGLV